MNRKFKIKIAVEKMVKIIRYEIKLELYLKYVE